MRDPVRAIARAMMSGWVKVGKSARAMQTFLRKEYGTAYRWTTLLGDYRQFSGRLKYEHLVSRVPRDAIVPRGYMVEVDLARDYRYRSFYTAYYRDPDTGVETERIISLYGDEMKSEEEMEEDYREMLKTVGYAPQPELQYVKLRSVEHNRGLGY